MWYLLRFTYDMVWSRQGTECDKWIEIVSFNQRPYAEKQHLKDFEHDPGSIFLVFFAFKQPEIVKRTPSYCCSVLIYKTYEKVHKLPSLRMNQDMLSHYSCATVQKR
jgi:hypothetical protein